MAQLELMLGREALGEMLRALREEVSQRATAIRAPGASVAVIGEEVHKLVSAAGGLGFRQLSARSRDLMQACRDGAAGANAGAVPALAEVVHEAAVGASRLIGAEIGADGAAEGGPAPSSAR